MAIEFMPFAGEERMLGTLEQTPEQLTEAYPMFGEQPDLSPPLILPSQYVPTWKNPGDNNDVYIEKQGGIGDQENQGACGAISGTEITELLQLKSGMAPELFTKLSWGQLYWSINGGQDRGSLPESVLKTLRTQGVASVKTCSINIRNPRQNWSAEQAADAQNNTITEWFLCPTWGHVVSALMQGFVVHGSLWWYQNDNVNGSGWLSDRPGGRKGGHSIRLTEYINENSRDGVRFPNTWTPRWGINGFGKVSRERIMENIKVWPYWAARTVKLPDPNYPIPKP